MKQIKHYNIENSPLTVIKQPMTMFLDLSPLRVIAEIKDSLSCQRFGDKIWTVDSVAEEKGLISLSCRNGKPDCLTLHVHSQRMIGSATMELQFETTSDSRESRVLCSETASYLMQRLKMLRQRHARPWI